MKNDIISEPGTLHCHFMGEYSKLDRVETMGTGYSWKNNAIWWNIKINLQKIGTVHICGYELWTANKPAKFHTKKLHRNENVPKSFFLGGGLLFWNTRYMWNVWFLFFKVNFNRDGSLIVSSSYDGLWWDFWWIHHWQWICEIWRSVCCENQYM